MRLTDLGIECFQIVDRDRAIQAPQRLPDRLRRGQGAPGGANVKGRRPGLGILEHGCEGPGSRLLLEVAVLHIFHYAHDLHVRGSGIAPADAMAQGALVREEALLESFVDNHYSRRPGAVPIVKVAPGDPSNARGGKESGQGLVIAGVHLFAAGWVIAFDVHPVLPDVVRQNRKRYGAGRLHSG